MSDDLHDMGPVDYIVVEFPDQRFTGEPLRRLLDLVDGGLIRVLDLVVLRKDEDGSVTELEVTDLDGEDELAASVFHGAASGLVDHDDIARAAGVLGPDRTAAVLVYANLWAAPFTAALRGAGAELVAGGRIPFPDLLDSIDAVESAAPVGA
ncbi:MAG: DUF6325 family protein [Pseudonocardia sediminis]